MKLSDLTAKTKAIVVEIEGEIVHLEVRVQLITPKLIADLTKLGNDTLDADHLLAVSEHVARLVAAWDVLDDAGQMFPLVAERLAAEIPAIFQMRCLTAAVQAMGETPAPEAVKQAA